METRDTAQHLYAMATKGKECKDPGRSLVAATFEKTKTYVFAEWVIHNTKVFEKI